eukprot:750605-Hanusia_phi.AAC.1
MMIRGGDRGGEGYIGAGERLVQSCCGCDLPRHCRSLHRSSKQSAHPCRPRCLLGPPRPPPRQGERAGSAALRRFEHFFEIQEGGDQEGESKGSGEKEGEGGGATVLRDGIWMEDVSIAWNVSAESEDERTKSREAARRGEQQDREDTLSSASPLGGGEEEKVKCYPPPILEGLTVKIDAGSLVGVEGKVGSGKTSLLLAMMGEIAPSRGRMKSLRQFPDAVAWVPQNPWIFNASLRENILLGRKWEEEKYRRVCEACALNEDLVLLPRGDLTRIGERGVNLSGGQKVKSAVRMMRGRTLCCVVLCCVVLCCVVMAQKFCVDLYCNRLCLNALLHPAPLCSAPLPSAPLPSAPLPSSPFPLPSPLSSPLSSPLLSDRQRLSLARAAYSSSAFVLLDDPLADATRIIVSHDEFVLKDCNKLLHLEHGSMTVSGDYYSLHEATSAGTMEEEEAAEEAAEADAIEMDIIDPCVEETFDEEEEAPEGILMFMRKFIR